MFYFVRHGKTDYSERNTGIYQGFGAELAPLSEEGIKQIKKAAKDKRLKGADIIISSPYTRALQTAAILSRKLDVKIAVETDLHEWVADKSYSWIDDETADRHYDEFAAGEGRYPEGEDRPWEDAQTIKQRVLAVLKKYAGYKKVIVVGHGMMIQATTGCAHPDNGQIVEFRLDE